MDKTLQNALKELFYSLGGNSETVRDTDDINVIIEAIAALGLCAKIEEGGGSDILVASATLENDPTSETYGDPGAEIELDKTFAELAVADNSVVQLTYSGETTVLPLVGKTESEIDYAVITMDGYLLTVAVVSESATLKNAKLSTE